MEVPWAKVTLWVVPGSIFSLRGWHGALTTFNICLASFSDNADFSKEGLVEVTSWPGAGWLLSQSDFRTKQVKPLPLHLLRRPGGVSRRLQSGERVCTHLRVGLDPPHSRVSARPEDTPLCHVHIPGCL